MRKKKQSLITGIILLIVALGIGYAYLNTTLNISGTTDVDANTWNVYWDNVVVTEGSVTASTPTIDTSKTTVSFNVHLEKPGDYYEFTVDAKNDGTIDAMIDTIIKTINGNPTVPDYLNYTVTYEDGFEIEENQLLNANEKETYKVRIEYKTDIDLEDLPNTDENLNIVFATTCIQANSSAQKVRNYIYAFSSTAVQNGDNISVIRKAYDSAEEVVRDTKQNYFSRHLIKDNIIIHSDLGIALNKTGTVEYYYLGGEKSYEQNKQIIDSIATNCSMKGNYYSCTSFPVVGSIFGEGNALVEARAYLIGGVMLVGNYTCNNYGATTETTRCWYD